MFPFFLVKAASPVSKSQSAKHDVRLTLHTCLEQHSQYYCEPQQQWLYSCSYSSSDDVTCVKQFRTFVELDLKFTYNFGPAAVLEAGRAQRER